MRIALLLVLLPVVFVPGVAASCDDPKYAKDPECKSASESGRDEDDGLAMDPYRWTFIALGALGLGGAAFGLRAFWFPPLRYGVAALFARLTRRDVRDHPFRARILDVVGARPGIPAAELAKSLAVNPGTLDYHIDVLERDSQLRTTKAGRNRILFLPGADIDVGGLAELTAQGRSDVARMILQEPGLSASTLSERLDLTRATIHHHLNRLEASGLIRVERGVRARCYPTDRLGRAIEPIRRRRVAVLAKPTAESTA